MPSPSFRSSVRRGVVVAGSAVIGLLLLAPGCRDEPTSSGGAGGEGPSTSSQTSTSSKSSSTATSTTVASTTTTTTTSASVTTASSTGSGAMWTCDVGHQGTDDGCDCGCGIVDPDCADATIDSCEYCDDMGSCSPVGCPGGIDAANNATCHPSAAESNAAACSDNADNDIDGDVDCADADCTGIGACPPAAWTCDPTYYGTNDGCDCGCGVVDPDCADATADSCVVCNDMGSCSMLDCPGAIDPVNNAACHTSMPENTDMACSDNVDNDIDGDVDCNDANCVNATPCLTLAITMVDYPVIAHGGRLVITGIGFTGATSVTIGGVAETGFVVDSDTQITIPSVLDATPIGAQNLAITVGGMMTPAFSVTPIRLQINELDSDGPGADAIEFVEISTGVPNVSLAGYTLVLYNGTNDASYRAVDLGATTDANGFLMAGTATVMPTPPAMCQWPNSTLQNGQDAAALYQAAPSAFPANTPVTAMKVIDALVYDTNDADDPELLMTLGTGVQVDEGAGGAGGPAEMQSIQRCGNGRLSGAKFAVGAPTPGAANGVTPCP